GRYGGARPLLPRVARAIMGRMELAASGLPLRLAGEPEFSDTQFRRDTEKTLPAGGARQPGPGRGAAVGDGPSTILQALLDRMNQGDRAARRELLDRACGRLRRLAGTMLAGSFPALQGHHELDSVVHETWLRLVQALEQTDPPTVADFFRLAAHKI